MSDTSSNEHNDHVFVLTDVKINRTSPTNFKQYVIRNRNTSDERNVRSIARLAVLRIMKSLANNEYEHNGSTINFDPNTDMITFTMRELKSNEVVCTYPYKLKLQSIEHTGYVAHIDFKRFVQFNWMIIIPYVFIINNFCLIVFRNHNQ
jgi:hypothetical protein